MHTVIFILDQIFPHVDACSVNTTQTDPLPPFQIDPSKNDFKKVEGNGKLIKKEQIK